MSETTTAAILGLAGTSLSRDEAAFFRQADPFGFILFARNIESPDQVRALAQDLRSCVGRDAPILIDQEGGRVQRMRAPHWREWLPPLDHVARVPPASRARAMWLRYRLIAEELHTIGIDVNCAPTSDVACAETHPFLYNRCLSEEADEVGVLARAAATGLMAGGVLPVVKHIPGHGRAVADSHLTPPRVSASVNDLRARDFVPFRALADMPMGMTAHVIFEAIDSVRPATVSETAIGLIRHEIGFDGLLMTDDLAMEALSGPVEARVVAALAAGCDVALYCRGDMRGNEAAVAAAGTLRGRARERAQATLQRRIAPDGIDTRALEAELEALLDGQANDGTGRV
ncbi:beta-N-acetylhexosaminidase [Albidovulum inexpectatum]|uniref:beta-N-acetylhexosaminidase n=1 Tax=Albidovulum inexpectatum TaxID=196587 RepID=A0A2S5JF64_9RHOB|nr:glycoside hydrolase family 3 N-terminal domain-containing protein [Albidovulum inexpectatum]PPB80008.1 beta-N-acetylhexosaminidase [Albidovulum inexpectatum]